MTSWHSSHCYSTDSLPFSSSPQSVWSSPTCPHTFPSPNSLYLYSNPSSATRTTSAPASFLTHQSSKNHAHVSPQYPSQNNPHTSHNLHIPNSGSGHSWSDCTRISHMCTGGKWITKLGLLRLRVFFIRARLCVIGTGADCSGLRNGCNWWRMWFSVLRILPYWRLRFVYSWCSLCSLLTCGMCGLLSCAGSFSDRWISGFAIRIMSQSLTPQTESEFRHRPCTKSGQNTLAALIPCFQCIAICEVGFRYCYWHRAKKFFFAGFKFWRLHSSMDTLSSYTARQSPD